VSCRIAIRVTPRSARPGIGGWREGPQGRELEVRVREAPSDGAANEAVIRLLADHLGITRSEVEITSGQSSRHKRLMIAIEPEMLAERLGA
jgi:uncharacterized protein (TIGR00251 family)